ncbi:hypothetical protein P4S63_22195 [Pseudoalteromonas sp. B193]
MMPQHLSQVMEDLAATYNGEFSQWVGDELLEQKLPDYSYGGSCKRK